MVGYESVVFAKKIGANYVKPTRWSMGTAGYVISNSQLLVSCSHAGVVLTVVTLHVYTETKAYGHMDVVSVHCRKSLT